MAMHTFFEVRVRYEKVMETGTNKQVTEPYLIDALSFTEAEARIIEEMKPFISGEFKVKAVKQANYSELFFSNDKNADIWYKAKLAFVTLDEKSGAEKKTYTNILIQALDLRNAIKRLDEGMKGTMADYKIVSISETKIMDVYLYTPDKEQ
jgi:hypothetical protein|uniref:DUF4494 domain-containing protein n=1 Tax=Bacteroides ovatus TaxID=28116 RepID=UPI0020680BCD|nr:MAG TPA: protein of unknown function (DUF4494) [Caudoviricetes sp.]